MPDSRSFHLHPEDVGSRVRILGVHGEADRFRTDALSAAVAEARDAGLGVIIDLSHATYLDSSMLATLVSASEQWRRRSQPLVILCEPTRLRRSLELKGLETILTLAVSREQALELVELPGAARPDKPEADPA
jgi:anti-anti-sigma factor